MKKTILLAVGLLLVSGWPQDRALAQTVPPMSLAPPKALPSRTGPTKPPTIGTTEAPSPALDYDGFSVGGDESVQAVSPPGLRAARRGIAGSSSLDPDDESLKRKLIICQNCK